MKTNVVGTQFSKPKAEGIEEGVLVLISEDLNNKYDKKALAVSFDSEHLGYIGKNSDVYEMDRDEFPLEAVVISFYRKVEGDKFEKHDLDSLVACTIEVPDGSSTEKKSFTEDLMVEFNEDTHIYTYKGKELIGGTSFIKKYMKPFDNISVSEACSKHWKVSAGEIKDAWSMMGDMARDYGSGIHKALEFEETYKSFVKPKDGTRCFFIKHPVLRKIVEDFYILYDSLEISEGQVLSEVLVSDVENGLSGLIDRLVVTSWDEKTCRLQDFKVNHSFLDKGQENFIGLPEGLTIDSNKLSKLSLQLKYYAALLEKQGWTVQGFDAFVYDEKWEHYSADMLEGFDIINNTYDLVEK